MGGWGLLSLVASQDKEGAEGDPSSWSQDPPPKSGSLSVTLG